MRPMVLLRAGLAVLAASALSSADEGAAKPLVVCAIPASMPRMDKAPDGTPRGLDVALVQQLARALGRPVEFHWCASADCAWHCLPEGRCAVVIGQPQD